MKIAKDRSLPIDTPARTITVLGQKGSGKTYLGMKLTELLLAAGTQVVCLDPTGVWWGLKAEGTGPGFPILVMGGDHGDVPLAFTSGAIVADFVVSSGQSVVLDLSHFNSNAEQDRFVCDFAERLYRVKSKQRSPLHVMMDEADAFAPQNPMRGGLEPRMLGAIETIVRRGRSRGLGMTMITQRPAVLNKNVMEQSDLIIATRILGKNDHASIRGSTKLWATDEQQDEFLEALPSLPTGHAFFWSPEWLNCFQEHAILPKRTMDTSRTPEPGQKVQTPKLAKVDIAKLSAQILATVEDAKKNDPTELKRLNASLVQENSKAQARITTLLQEIEKLKARPPAEVPKEVSVFTDADRDSMDKLTLALQGAVRKVNDKPQIKVVPAPPAGPDIQVHRAPARPPAVSAPTNGTPADLPAGERVLLIAAAQYPEGLTREQASVLTSYKRSTRDRYLQYLSQKGFIEIRNSDVFVTQAGINALGRVYQPLPTGSQLQAYWLDRLPEGEAKILRVLIEGYPDAVDRDALDEPTGFKRSTRDRYLQYLSARKLIAAGGRGSVMASKLLFD